MTFNDTSLLDIERIRQLKARYFRSLDARDWMDFSRIFTEDVRTELPSGAVFQNRAQLLTHVSRRVGERRSAHQGFCPEIAIASRTTACGLWAMSFAEAASSGSDVVHGYGQYVEEYLRDDHQWRISSLRLTLHFVDRDVAEYGVPSIGLGRR